MKIIKYRHACMVLEMDSGCIVIDPGNWSTDLVTPSKVLGIIITHQHPDHFDAERLKIIVDAYPAAIIYADTSVIDQLHELSTQVVSPGAELSIGEFDILFGGGTHAIIHQSLPKVTNLTVMVNHSFYYPGDSFERPIEQVDYLALPVSAPWMKLSEAIDFLTIVHPKEVLPVHDAILSNEGKELVDRMIGRYAEKEGTQYHPLL